VVVYEITFIATSFETFGDQTAFMQQREHKQRQQKKLLSIEMQADSVSCSYVSLMYHS
jgi:hypothetical protein